VDRGGEGKDAFNASVARLAVSPQLSSPLDEEKRLLTDESPLPPLASEGVLRTSALLIFMLLVSMEHSVVHSQPTSSVKDFKSFT